MSAPSLEELRAWAIAIYADLTRSEYDRQQASAIARLCVGFMSLEAEAKHLEAANAVLKADLAGVFACCGGSDEHPPQHCQDCPGATR